MEDKTVGNFLIKFSQSKDEGYITLVVCPETRGGHPEPHAVSLHRLGIGPCIDSEESEVPIYVWSSYTCSGHASMSVQVDLPWVLAADDKFTMKKVAAVDATIWDADPSDERLPLYLDVDMEKVRAPGGVYIPRYLTTALLTRVSSLQEAWSIIRYQAEKLRMSEACMPFLAWLWVRLLADYVRLDK